MKKAFLLICYCFCSIMYLPAQEVGICDSIPEKPEENAYLAIYHPKDCGALSREEQTNCSQKAIMTEVYPRIRYPHRAIERGVEGSVIIRFVIDKNGNAVAHNIFKDLDEGCGEAALKAVLSLTDWAPGRDENGNPMNVMITLPLRFKLVGP